MPTPEGKTLDHVSETRVIEGRIEGLCQYTDGTSEWRPPDVTTAEGKITRADGTEETINLELT